MIRKTRQAPAQHGPVAASSSHKYVVVRWLDACSKDEWHNPNDTVREQECLTGGWLLDETANCLTLTHTLGVVEGKTVDTCCAIAIPKGCVTHVFEVPSLEKKMRRVRGRMPRRK